MSHNSFCRVCAWVSVELLLPYIRKASLPVVPTGTRGWRGAAPLRTLQHQKGTIMSRSLFIKVRVTPDEKRHYETLALQAGITLSDFIRKRLHDFRIRPKEIESERIRQLARIGNNLNQIARWANAYKNELEAISIIAGIESLRRDLQAYSDGTLKNQHDN